MLAEKRSVFVPQVQSLCAPRGRATCELHLANGSKDVWDVYGLPPFRGTPAAPDPAAPAAFGPQGGPPPFRGLKLDNRAQIAAGHVPRPLRNQYYAVYMRNGLCVCHAAEACGVRSARNPTSHESTPGYNVQRDIGGLITHVAEDLLRDVRGAFAMFEESKYKQISAESFALLESWQQCPWWRGWARSRQEQGKSELMSMVRTKVIAEAEIHAVVYNTLRRLRAANVIRGFSFVYVPLPVPEASLRGPLLAEGGPVLTYSGHYRRRIVFWK